MTATILDPTIWYTDSLAIQSVYNWNALIKVILLVKMR